MLGRNDFATVMKSTAGDYGSNDKRARRRVEGGFKG